MSLEFFEEMHKIGIIGGGHLGQAIAAALIKQGFINENLYISYRENPSTFQTLEKKGLLSSITQNEKIFEKADLIFITVKPQDIFTLKNVKISEDSLIISCVAGISYSTLKRLFCCNVCRIMISGPDTVLTGNGVATVYPTNEKAEKILSFIGADVIKIENEDELNVFTTGVCLPAAILFIDNINQCEEEIKKISVKFPLFLNLFNWAKKATPHYLDKKDKDEYIRKMITKGGITETVIQSLKIRETLEKALENGVNKCREFSENKFKIDK